MTTTPHTYTTSGTTPATCGPVSTVGDAFTLARSPHTAYSTRATTVGYGYAPLGEIQHASAMYEAAVLEENAAYDDYIASRRPHEEGTYEAVMAAMIRRQQAFNNYMYVMQDA